MKTLKQILQEIYVDSAKSFYGIVGDIFINPTRKEMMECEGSGIFKGIIVDKYDVYFFSPELMHRNIVDKLGLNINNVITIEVQSEYPTDKKAIVFITSTNTAKVKGSEDTVHKIIDNKYLTRTFNITEIMDSLGHSLYQVEI